MKNRVLYLVSFLAGTALLLSVSLWTLFSLPSWQVATEWNRVGEMTEDYQLFGSLPAVKGVYSASVDVRDARARLIVNFLHKYDSPMKPYENLSQYIVQLVDKNGFPQDLDFLLVAIAMCESNLGKKIPEGTYNPLGWGIHARGTLGFESWQAAFEAAANGLGRNYIGRGHVTAEDIMSMYTPQSNGSWSRCVNQYMAEIEKGSE